MQSYPFTSHVTYDSDGNPQFDRAVDSTFLRTYYQKDRSNGVVMLTDSNSFSVVAGTGMTVVAKPGYAFIQGAYAVETEERTLAVQAADTMDRIDAVVLRLNETNRDIDLYVVKGTPAVSPIPPELTRSNLIYEICIAQVFVTANSTTISQAKITDTRMNTTICGYSLPFQEIDTSGFNSQLQALVTQTQTWAENEQAEIEETLNEAISGTLAGSLQTQINARTQMFTGTATISTTWSGSSAPYSQTIAVSGVTADMQMIVDLDGEVTDEQNTDYAKITRIVGGDGNITVYASGTTTNSIPIKLLGIYL